MNLIEVNHMEKKKIKCTSGDLFLFFCFSFCLFFSRIYAKYHKAFDEEWPRQRRSVR